MEPREVTLRWVFEGYPNGLREIIKQLGIPLDNPAQGHFAGLHEKLRRP